MTSDLPPTGGLPPSAAPQPPPAAPTPPGRSGHATDDFFQRVRSFGVIRTDDGRWAAGVAGGLARRWDIDPVLIRGGFVALALFGGIGVVLYGLAWLLFPQEDGRIHLQQAIHGDITAGFVGSIILCLAALGGGHGPWDNGIWIGGFFPGGLLLTAAVVYGIWWLAHNRDQWGTANTSGAPTTASPTSSPATSSSATSSAATSSPATSSPVIGAPTAAGPAPVYGSAPSFPSGAERAGVEKRTKASKVRRARTRPPKALVRLTLGLALLAAAGVALLGSTQDWDTPPGLIAAATALLVIAVGVIVCGLIGRRAAGLAGLGFLLAVGTLIGAGAHEAGVRSGQNLTLVGSREWRPGTADEASSQFNLGVGDARLWLTDPAILTSAPAGQPVRVRVRVGAGQFVLMVPRGVSTRVDVQMGAGQVIYPDGSTHRIDGGRDDDDIRHRTITSGPAGTPRIVVDVQQGAGEVEVRSDAVPAPAAPDAPTASTAPTPSAP
jgi:phage shock protein PspC (stress-responsive transcriptional regulator)